MNAKYFKMPLITTVAKSMPAEADMLCIFGLFNVKDERTTCAFSPSFTYDVCFLLNCSNRDFTAL